MARINKVELAKRPEWNEGALSAASGGSFRTSCPYTFDRCGVDVETFNEKYRIKMDAWFYGWQDYRERARVAAKVSSRSSDCLDAPAPNSQQA